MKVPLFVSLRGYRSGWLRGDVLAGLTVWAVLVPESLAYATIAGVSPVVGLYAAPAALILYAAFGSSKHLIAGPMAATAALSAAAVAQFAGRGASQSRFGARKRNCGGSRRLHCLARVALLPGSHRRPSPAATPR